METLQRTANRGSISTGYDIDNSVKLEADNSEKLSRTVSTAGNRDVGTISMWIKRTELSTYQYLCQFGNTDNDNGRTFVRFQNDDTLRIAGGSTVWRNTNRVFRDTSAWYHIVIAFDTTQTTANDRFKLYVNGVQETSFSSTANPSQYDNLGINFQTQAIGYNPTDSGSYFSGYMTEIVCQDGTASAPTEFGETDSDTGIWKPIDVSSVASGTNGFYLDFESSGSLGADSSGNGNNFTLNNITSADQATDTPTNSFSTWNILNRYFSTTINEGATKVTNSDVANWRSYVSTIAVSSGKWYAEFEAGGTSFIGVGDVSEITGTKSYTQYLGQIPASIGYYSAGLLFYSGASQSGSFTGFGDGDVISCALDKDNGFVYWAKNGVWQNSGDPTSGATGTGGVALTSGNAGYEASDQYIIGYSPLVANSAGFANYGGFTTMSISSGNPDSAGYGNFEYAPPSGYYALCTKNLAEYG